MAKAARKKPVAPMIVFSRARDIPFNRIRLSDSNVRETDVEAGLDELTHDIDRREDLVQGLNVRAILDEDGNEAGPAPVLFRSRAHVRRPFVRRPLVISSRGLNVSGAGCRSR